MTPCRHEEGAKHDCHYVDTRNGLIPQAMEIADGKVLGEPGETLLQRRARWEWSRIFLETMDNLYHSRNLS